MHYFYFKNEESEARGDKCLLSRTLGSQEIEPGFEIRFSSGDGILKHAS